MKDFKFVKTENSSVAIQDWSMFKGLAKDADKEIGNSSDWDVGLFGTSWFVTKNGQKFKGPFFSMKAAQEWLQKVRPDMEEVGNSKVGNAMNKKVKNSSVREYEDSKGRIAQIDFNSDGTDADMAIYEDERMLKSVEQRNFSTIRDAEQYVQSHGFRRVG